ncbi:Zinc finger, CCHC-type superfamily [Sesbania bispinosa]|nr:Zinc finger, CCHC-type superfamily [Sesbania bispinosa]
MENLITSLLRVPSPKTSYSHLSTTDGSAMMTTSGFRGGRAIREGRGGRGARAGRWGNRPYCTYCKRPGHTQETCYSIHGFPEKTVNLTQSMHIQEDGKRYEVMSFFEVKIQEYM